MHRNFAALVVGLATVVAASGIAEAQRGPGRGPDAGWELLGCAEFRRDGGAETINVGRREGRYRAIQVRAVQHDVEIDDLKVIYGNGQPDDIRVRSVFREGSVSRVIDLKGDTRFIRQINILGRKVSRGRGPAKFCVVGLEVAGPRGDIGRPGVVDDRRQPGPQRGAGGRWEQLGCQRASKGLDRDELPVGRREGRFRAIELAVQRNDVFIEQLAVIYSNGERDVIPVSRRIKRGERSGPLDLQGNRRGIERVQLVYRSKLLTLRGDAEICVFGLQ